MTFFHISYTWNKERVLVEPRINHRIDSNDDREKIPCICVCPTIQQCVVALGAWYDYFELRIYETDANATPAEWVFDYCLTNEHRIYTSAHFNYIKTIQVQELIKKVPPIDLCGKSDKFIIKNIRKTLTNLNNYLS